MRGIGVAPGAISSLYCFCWRCQRWHLARARRSMERTLMRDVATLLTLFSSPRPGNRGSGRFSVVNINPSSRRRRAALPSRSVACRGASPGGLPPRSIVVVLCGAAPDRARGLAPELTGENPGRGGLGWDEAAFRCCRLGGAWCRGNGPIIVRTFRVGKPSWGGEKNSLHSGDAQTRASSRSGVADC